MQRNEIIEDISFIINNLIYRKLPTNMSKKNKNNRVRYILKKEDKIENEGSLT